MRRIAPLKSILNHTPYAAGSQWYGARLETVTRLCRRNRCFFILVQILITVVNVKIVVAMAVAASLAFPLAFGNNEPAEDQPAAYSSGIQYGVEHIENRVQQAVFDTILQYARDGVAAFDAITPDTPQYVDAIHPFALNATTLKYVADASALHERGEFEDGLERGDRTREHVLGDIGNDGGAWFEYLSQNPGNGEREFKRVWLQEYDGYLFGAGYFLPDAGAQEVVHQAVELYAAKGNDAFGIITPDASITTAALYPFVVNASSPDLLAVAHGAFPDRIGRSATAAISGTSDRPFEEVVGDLNRDGGTWVEYIFTNPDTLTDQLKRTWLYPYDGLIFASGYYVPDVRLQTLVAETIRTYNVEGEDVFDIITPDESVHSPGSYPFVIDVGSLKMEAHGAFPHMVGELHYLDAADKSLEKILEELDEYGEAWVAYVSENPGTRTDQLTRSYLKTHDGYIFGAGYSFPDSRAVSKVDEAIYTYRANPDPTFADINAGALNEFGLSLLVTNSTHILASGNLPVAGTQLSTTNIQAMGSAGFIVFSKPLLEHIRLAQEADGQEYWSQEIGGSTYHGMSLITNYAIRSYDDFAFISNYVVAEGDVQSRVDLALFSYAENGRAAFDAITPDKPVMTDETYPFVLNATTLEVVAYGASPDIVGTTYESVRDTSTRPFDEVLADMKRDGYVWVLHTSINPLTNKEQLKQSWLQERDGYIFGAGYYVVDMSARSTSSYFMIVYDHAPSLLNTPLGEGWLAFIVDPLTGLTYPDNDTSAPWASITAEVPADEILRVLETEPGMWVTYRAVNPLNDMEDDVRVWMSIYDGYVFGTVFYETGWVRPNP